VYQRCIRGGGETTRAPHVVTAKEYGTMAKKPKFTRAQIKTHIENVQQAIEKLKREAENRGELFRSLTPEEIEKKLKRANSPFLSGSAWAGTTSPGGTVPFSFQIYNPDTTQVNWLFMHCWIGTGNADPFVSSFLLNVDTRFPRLTEPARDTGLTVAAGADASLSFALKVPTTVEKTSYIGQGCLFRANWLDVGQYLDRGMFSIEVK
jgi:hypothetical protein